MKRVLLGSRVDNLARAKREPIRICTARKRRKASR